MPLVNVSADVLPVLAESAIRDLLREINSAADRVETSAGTLEHHPDRITKHGVLRYKAHLDGLLAAYRALTPSLRLLERPASIVRAEAIADAAIDRLSSFA